MLLAVADYGDRPGQKQTLGL